MSEATPEVEQPLAEAGWIPARTDRRQQVLRGLTVVANASKGHDKSLREWAEAAGLLVRIHRPRQLVKETDPLVWRNPYKMVKARKGSVCDKVCDEFAAYLAGRDDLLAHVHELKGKVLLCWCHPERCHGDWLAGRANGAGG